MVRQRRPERAPIEEAAPVHAQTGRPLPAWVPRVKRVLDILGTGGGILLTEPKPAKRR
jgi:hypothetical protein